MNSPSQSTFLFTFVLLMGVACPTFAADNPKKPHQVINDLRQKMYAIGETTGKLDQFVAAERKAAQDIHEFATGTSGPATLAEKNAQGQTPLMAAAFMGYSEVVTELLKHDIVKESINEVNPKGISAWVYATLAFRQALWVCNPATLKDPFTIVPLLVTQPYYQQSTENPYKKTRRLLEAAGAKTDMLAAKDIWMDTCKLQDEATKEKVEKADDLLAMLLDEGAKKINNFIIQQSLHGRSNACKDLHPVYAHLRGCGPALAPVTPDNANDKVNQNCLLEVAVYSRDLNVFRQLLRNGADITLCAPGYPQRLYKVLVSSPCDFPKGSTEEFLLLLESLGVEMTDKQELLKIAASGGCAAAVRFLATRNADLNFEYEEGLRPLHYVVNVATEEKIETARTLVSLGANPYLRSRNGESAIDRGRRILLGHASNWPRMEAILSAYGSSTQPGPAMNSPQTGVR